MGRLKSKYSLLLFFTWGLFFILLFSRMISMRPDGLYMGHPNLWGDWALHISLANTFAQKPAATWFAYHPGYADGKLTYAFLVNFISALLMRLGLSLSAAFILPSIVLSLLLIEGMHQLLRQLLGSSKRAILAISIFFLSSGLGFFAYLNELVHNPAGADWLGRLVPVRDYSRMENYGWLAGNYIVGHLLPQRAFLLGMTLAIWALCGIFHVLLKPSGTPLTRQDRTILVCAGLASGVLPIAHMHSLIALFFLLVPTFLCSMRKFRVWLWYGIPNTVLALVLYKIFVAGGIQRSGFMSWAPGYMAQGWGDWLKFWGLAWGPMIPLAAYSLLAYRRTRARETQVFLAAFFGLWAFANLVLTQPMQWDNSKHFLWSYFGFAALAADLLFRLWISPRRSSVRKPLVVALTGILVFTGILELIVLQRVDTHTYRLLDREELTLAEKIRAETDPLARFLTNHDHNHPIMVWAVRPILLGFLGYAYNYGFDYAVYERDIPIMYQGGEPSISLLKQYRIDYVFVGPGELRDFHPNEGFFKSHFPIAFESPNYRIYKIR